MARATRAGTNIALAASLFFVGGSAAQAANLPVVDFELLADARLSIASGEPTWFDDWLGKLRYGGNLDGDSRTRFRLANLSVIAKSDITWDLGAFVHAKYDPEQDKPLDLVEAYLRYKPAPRSNLRYEVRAGLMFPHISRENISIAWTSPFTITPSAVNSWVGEEIRTLGVEAKATLKMDGQKLSLTGSVFGFNDPAGTLLAFRGWAMGDYTVGAFSQLPLPPLPQIGTDSTFLKQPLWVHPVKEVDDRVGFYGALDWEMGRTIKAGVFYYDNNGDPDVIRDKQYGWDTRFWNAYAEVEAPFGIKLISQYLTGSTAMGPLLGGEDRPVDVDYASGFILATRKLGRHRISLRRDWFDVDDTSFVARDNNNEVGSAWTAALSFRLDKQSFLMTEFLRVTSNRPGREDIGFEPEQTQNQIQVSYRRRF